MKSVIEKEFNIAKNLVFENPDKFKPSSGGLDQITEDEVEIIN